jgi:hypothetical protein
VRKNVFLLGSIFNIFLFVFTIFQISRPKIGPIGSGEMSTFSWILIFFPLVLGIIFLMLFIALSTGKKNTKDIDI